MSEAQAAVVGALELPLPTGYVWGEIKPGEEGHVARLWTLGEGKVPAEAITAQIRFEKTKRVTSGGGFGCVPMTGRYTTDRICAVRRLKVDLSFHF